MEIPTNDPNGAHSPFPILHTPRKFEQRTYSQIFLTLFQDFLLRMPCSTFNLAFSNAERIMSHLVRESPVAVADALSFEMRNIKANWYYLMSRDLYSEITKLQWKYKLLFGVSKELAIKSFIFFLEKEKKRKKRKIQSVFKDNIEWVHNEKKVLNCSFLCDHHIRIR